MIRRMLAFALIAVFAVVLVGGCSDSEQESIEYTTKDYCAAYNAEDWEVCLGHIDDTNHIGESTIESVLKMARATATATMWMMRRRRISRSCSWET